LFYLFSGIVVNGRLIARSLSFSIKEAVPTLSDWLSCLYFAVITSTTVGYGDIQPAGALSRLFSAILSVLGLLFFTMFTVTFARRFFR
jgi:voltage-gated potassium channel Kch